jgi:EAL domain-containing protein (putative c-di-GMP-specific phosphodiesterase class I)
MLWQRMGLPPLRIAINVSKRQLRHGDLVETVTRVLAETGLPAARLDLEFREESLLEAQAQAPETFAAPFASDGTASLDLDGDGETDTAVDGCGGIVPDRCEAGT